MKTGCAAWLPAAAAIVAGGWLVSGCTFSNVKPSMKAAVPVERVERLVIGSVEITDPRIAGPQQEILLHAFRLGVKEWIVEHGAVLAVTEDVLVTVPPAQSLLVKGTIHNVEKGSQALRFWVGMGAGQAKMKGTFEVLDASGKKVNQFEVNRSYLGGAGAGGWDMVEMEDLARQLGQSVGETIAEWVAGKNLDRTN